MNALKAWQSISRVQLFLRDHPNFAFFKTPVRLPMEPRKSSADHNLFYVLVGIIGFYALVKILFPRYIQYMFSIFWRGNLRGQQIREQMLQTPQASLLMNFLFLLSAGMYITFLARHYAFAITDNFWKLFLYGIAFLMAIYTGKFLFLKFFGWIFNMTRATDAYIFTVFLTNKIIGILLLPVVVLMAFPFGNSFETVLMLSLILIILLFLYRFIISYTAVNREIKVKRLHFFAYLCAFEIAPLLLIYKVLLNLMVSIT